MKLKIGDVLVFTGNKIGETHYDNFVVGQSYRVQNISVLYDADISILNDNSYVLFENFKYGALSYYIPLHFVHLDDYREEKINKIL